MQKPLLEHLIELRKRLIYCLATFFVAFLISYHFAADIFSFLVQPLSNLLQGQEGRRMIYTGLTEAFLTYLSVSFFTALFLTLPLILWQLWKFIAPGLYRNEKTVFSSFFFATPVLFFAGAAVAYYVVCPMAWEFFLSFETTTGPLPVQLEARVGEYLSLVLKLVFAFGLSFQLPVILVLLAKVGVLSSGQLASKRKYAFLSIVIFAAVITPPDIISPISLIIPLYALYEISLILVKGVERKIIKEGSLRA